MRVSNLALLTSSLSVLSPQLNSSFWTSLAVTEMTAGASWLRLGTSSELQDLCAMMGEEEDIETSSLLLGLEEEVMVKWAGLEHKSC